ACGSSGSDDPYGMPTNTTSGAPTATTDGAGMTATTGPGTVAGSTTGGPAVTSSNTTGTTGAATTTGTSGVGGAASTSTTGAGTTGTGTTGTGIDPGPTDYELDCGANGIVLEAHGPPDNRINYIIVGDGYTASELDTTYVEHLAARMEGDEDSPGRFDPALEPYRTYRNFVNICALKIAS